MVERKPKVESKFAGIFQSAPPPVTEPAPERAEALPVKSVQLEPRPIGRPPGKRSDPEWKQFSVLLKKRTQREASVLLRAEQDEDDGRDLSDLLQELLASWVDDRRRA